MAKRLSKSRYTLFCQCPKALWLRTYKPEKAEVDEALQARFEKGNEVGDKAMGLFGEYKVVTSYKDGSLDLTKMIELTQQYIAEGVENICEASFNYEGNYCAVDVLHKEKDGWAIYEVKSTSFPLFNEKKTKLEKYAPDIAYQKWVLTQCGIHVTGTYLVCLNSDYVREGDLDIDKQCDKPYHCAFFNYCKEQHGVPTPSVFDVYGGHIGCKKEDSFYISQKLKLYHEGKMSFEDIKDEPLGHVQRLQVEGKLFIDKKGIREFLNTLSYPLYFLDYETMQDPIPQFSGVKVYAQVTFQYSLHIIDNPATLCNKKGYGYLAPSNGKDPRRALAEDLCKHIPKDVCIVAYNKQFEVSRTQELAALYPDLADHLLNIALNIKDLLDPFQAGFKKVLPALFPNDPELDYHNLDERVQNGGDAMTIFPKIKDMPPAEADATRTALLNYCNLDTWAMVKVWQKLIEVTK